MVVEQNERSTRPIATKQPFYKPFPEFDKASYLDRYEILCSKLITERHYTSACVLAVSPEEQFENKSEVTSIQRFIVTTYSHVGKNRLSVPLPIRQRPPYRTFWWWSKIP